MPIIANVEMELNPDGDEDAAHEENRGYEIKSGERTLILVTRER